MTSRPTRATMAVFGAAALLVGTASHATAADNRQSTVQKNDPAATPSAYTAYLRHSHEEGATDALRAFQDLSQAEQAKFLDYLHDPAVLKSAFDKSADQSTGTSLPTRNSTNTTLLYDGDVVIDQERTISGPSVAAHVLSSGDHSVNYTTYVKVLGVKVIKLNLELNFHSNGRDITKVNRAEASKRNLSGVISLSHEKEKKWLSNWSFCERGKPCDSGHLANASVIWEGNVAYRGSVIQIDKKQYMRANVHGKLTDYYLHNA
ncbi:hypothetical protein [Streptomyces aquilus]|uniref:hypothetical protein n=1 Tax=Streptomyces aquilus TaxID=2548456 RepID=UPI0036B5A54D